MLTLFFSLIVVLFFWRLAHYFYYLAFPVSQELTDVDYERAFLRYYFFHLVYRYPSEEELDDMQQNKEVWFRMP